MKWALRKVAGADPDREVSHHSAGFGLRTYPPGWGFGFGGSGRPFVVSPPLDAGQALARRLLLPVRPRIGADMPQAVYTMRGPNVGAGTSSGQASALMIARWYPAAHVERPHAVRPHVAERQWLDRVIEASGRHARGLRRSPPAWQENRLTGVESVRRRVAPRAMSAHHEAGAGEQAPRSAPSAHEDPLHAYVTGINIRASLIVSVARQHQRDTQPPNPQRVRAGERMLVVVYRTVVRTTLAPGPRRRVRVFARSHARRKAAGAFWIAEAPQLPRAAFNECAASALALRIRPAHPGPHTAVCELSGVDRCRALRRSGRGSPVLPAEEAPLPPGLA
jgi:hypothetical protein